MVEGLELAAGTYELSLPGVDVTFTVPAGWSSWTYGVFPTQIGPEPPDGVGLGFWIVGSVDRDPCHWGRGADQQPLRPTTVAGLARALESQSTDGRPRPTSSATDVTLDGFSGLEMEIEVPRNLDLSNCTQDTFHSWTAEPMGGRTHQGPGQIDHLWILDVHGSRLVVDAAYFPETTDDARTALWDVVASISLS